MLRSEFGMGANNEAKLRAVIMGVTMCKEMRFSQVEIECDSSQSLVVNWITNHSCTVWYL